MRSEVSLLALVALLACMPAVARAQSAAQAPPGTGAAGSPPAPAEQPLQDRPEYRTRSLPQDTFKPSERVSEDYPVPFPEDI